MASVPAGKLRDRVTFSKFGEADGTGGNYRSNHLIAQCTLWAGIVPLNGGEEVMAGRLAGRRTAVVTVRQSSLSRAITTNWVARDKRTGETFNIREVKPRDNGREFFDILCESGVAP